MRHAVEREREGDDAAAVDGGRQLVRLDLGCGRHLGAAALLHGVAGEPVARSLPAAGARRARACRRACRSSCGGASSASAPHSSSSSPAGAFASSASTAATCSGRPGATRRRSRGRGRRGRSRARASGSAWNGFAAERRKETRPASPHSSTTAPSRTATAWTRCTASTVVPRRTSTLIGSAMTRGALDARTARDGGLAPPARRPRLGVPDREGRAGAHRDAEDVRPAARDPRRPPARGGASGAPSACSSRPTTASSS